MMIPNSTGKTLQDYAAVLEEALTGGDSPAASSALTQLLSVDPDNDLWWQLLPIIAPGPIEQRRLLEAIVAAVPGHFGALIRLNRVGLEALQEQRRRSEEQLIALSQTESELRARIERLNSECVHEERQLIELRSNHEQLATDHGGLCARLQELQAQVQGAEHKFSIAKEAGRDYEQTLHALQEVMRAHDYLYTRFVTAESEVQARSAELQRLQTAIESAEERLEQTTHEIAETEWQLNARRQECSKFDGLSIEVQRRVAELQDLRMRIAADEEELADKQRRSQAEQRRYEEVGRQRQRAEQNARRARNEAQAAWTEYQRLRDESEKLEAQLRGVEARLKVEQNRLPLVVGRTNKLKEEHLQLEATRAELIRATEQQQGSVTVLRQEIEGLTRTRDELLKAPTNPRKPAPADTPSVPVKPPSAQGRPGEAKTTTSLETKFRESKSLGEYLRLHEELSEELCAQAQSSAPTFYPTWWRALAALATRRAAQRVFEACVTAPLDEFGRCGEEVLRELVAADGPTRQWAEAVLSELAEQQQMLAGLGE